MREIRDASKWEASEPIIEAPKIAALVERDQNVGSQGLSEALKISNHFSEEIKFDVQVKIATTLPTIFKIA